MISVDSSVIIPWLNGVEHPETRLLADFLSRAVATIAPATLMEILSDPTGGTATDDAIAGFAVLPITDGYWERVGRLRGVLRNAGRKAGFADSLIAQASIDADVPLLTRDKDFATFAKLGGLKLHKVT